MSDQSTPSPVQPDGQGGEENVASGLYDLEAAPPEHRPFLESELKKIEGNVTKRFQEAKEFRDQWSPYAELGINDIPVERMQELVQFNELTADPEAFDNWLRYMAGERGILNGEGAGAETDEDPDDDDEEGFDLEGLLEERLGALLDERLGPLQQGLHQQQQEQAVAQAGEQVEQELNGLAEKHSVQLDDEARQAVFALALPFAEDQPDDAMRLGFERYLQLTGNAQRALVESKVTQPQAAVEGGRPNSAPDEIHGFKDAKAAALERMRGGL